MRPMPPNRTTGTVKHPERCGTPLLLMVSKLAFVEKRGGTQLWLIINNLIN